MKIHMISLCLLTGVGLYMGNLNAIAQETIPVDCGSGQMIAGALANASPGDTIQVMGVCREIVTITTDRLTLDGQGSAVVDGGGFEAGSFDEGVINIVGAQGVMISGLTVQNGPDGINGRFGAAFEVANTIVQDHADEGLQVDENSTARVNDCMVQRNASVGILVNRNSSVTLRGINVISDNSSSGLQISRSSSADLGGNVEIRNNAAFGIVVGKNSNGAVSSEAIVLVDQNSGSGLFVVNASSVDLDNNCIVSFTNNGSQGISISRTSSFEISPGCNVSSQNNARFGVRVGETSAAACFTATLTLTGNMDGERFVGDNSSFRDCTPPSMTGHSLDAPTLESEDLSF